MPETDERHGRGSSGDRYPLQLPSRDPRCHPRILVLTRRVLVLRGRLPDADVAYLELTRRIWRTVLQLMGALYMGNKPILKVDHKVCNHNVPPCPLGTLLHACVRDPQRCLPPKLRRDCVCDWKHDVSLSHSSLPPPSLRVSPPLLLALLVLVLVLRRFPALSQVAIVMDQFMRLLHSAGMPIEVRPSRSSLLPLSSSSCLFLSSPIRPSHSLTHSLTHSAPPSLHTRTARLPRATARTHSASRHAYGALQARNTLPGDVRY
eukprot:3727777-Rhodomonas_salina.2